MTQGQSKLRSYLDGLSSVAMLLAASLVVWTYWPRGSTQVSVPTEPIDVRDAADVGSQLAKLAVVEFSDFECPFCRSFSQSTFPFLRERYVANGKVRWFFKHFPIERLHKQAFSAAVAAECSRQQGKFWQAHDLLQSADLKRGVPDVVSALALEPVAFGRCAESSGPSRVKDDLNLATQVRLRGTPAFLIGTLASDGRVETTILLGATTPDEFARVLDSQLRPSNRRLSVLMIVGAAGVVVTGLMIWVRRARRQHNVAT